MLLSQLFSLKPLVPHFSNNALGEESYEPMKNGSGSQAWSYHWCDGALTWAPGHESIRTPSPTPINLKMQIHLKEGESLRSGVRVSVGSRVRQ